MTMTTRVGLPFLTAGGVGLATAGWTATVAPGAETALVVPALFVIAGLLGPVWDAARFTCRCLIAAGALHLAALALSAIAAQAGTLAGWWHTLSQVLFVGGFAVFLPLAAGYPDSRPPRAVYLWGAAAAVIPVIAGFAAPTAPVLAVDGGPESLGPIAAVLPPMLAGLAVVVFTLPLIAVAIAIVRAVRDGRQVRGRVTIPMLALLGMAVLLVSGAFLPPGLEPLSTALFLIAAPLVPAGLILGSRPTPPQTEPDLTAAAHSGRLSLLSPREREVLALMSEGQSNPAIGRSLHISVSAVEKHSTAIFTKLGLEPEPATHRRVAAVVAYLRAVDR
jgi:DNA-binding CsgD family transcriptional regulator